MGRGVARCPRAASRPAERRRPARAAWQGLASIGTLLEITEHSNLEDGRILINNVGRQRFRVLEVRPQAAAARGVQARLGAWAAGRMKRGAQGARRGGGGAAARRRRGDAWKLGGGAAGTSPTPPHRPLQPPPHNRPPACAAQVIEEKPVLVCDVEYLRDDEDVTAGTAEARSMAAEVSDLFRSVVALSVKLRDAT